MFHNATEYLGGVDPPMTRTSKREIERQLESLRPTEGGQDPIFAVEREDGTLVEPGGEPYEGGAPFKLPYELWNGVWAGEWDPTEERRPQL